MHYKKFFQKIKKVKKTLKKRLTRWAKCGKLYVRAQRGVIFLYGVFLLWQLKRQEQKSLLNAPNASIETTTVLRTKRTIPIDWFFPNTARSARSTPNTKNLNNL